MKIDRPNIDIQPFAGGSKTEERTAFGSKEITDNLEKNLNADFARGWGIVPVSELPTMQDFNAVGFTISSLVTHLYQNGIAEYAEKQIYNKGAVCLSEGNIYISKTENNAGNPLTDTTQWQSLKDAILAANIVQQLGNATDKVMSQKSVTDALNTKQVKGDYATKTDLTQGLNTKLNSSAVKQTTGNSTTDVMSQKAITDALNRATSIDDIYPVGIVLWFAQNKNPNTLFPNTKWQYIGENKTIRLAKADGSNVLTTGGADSIKLTEAQLPSHGHTFSGTTSKNGSHSHERGSMNITGIAPHTPSWGAGGAKGAFYTGGKYDAPGEISRNGVLLHFDASRSWTGKTSLEGEHIHNVNGTSSKTGNNSEVDIKNAFVTLMSWHRIS